MVDLSKSEDQSLAFFSFHKRTAQVLLFALYLRIVGEKYNGYHQPPSYFHYSIEILTNPLLLLMNIDVTLS